MAAYSSEIPEAEAPPDIAALYADLRAVMNIGMVNLFYRRAAAEPGRLAWIWDCLRPLFTEGAIGAAVAESRLDTGFPMAPQCEPALALVGLRQTEIAAIGRILADYNRGNAGNIFAFSALALFLQQDCQPGGPTRALSDRPRAPSPLPPILPMEAMSVDLAKLVEALSEPVSPADMPLIPSLYRHLARWPAYLALVAQPVMTLVRSPAFRTAADGLRAGAAASAPDLAARIRPSGTGPDGDDKQRLIATLSALGSGPVVEMTLIGHALLGWLPTAEQA